VLRAFRYFRTFSGHNGRGWFLTIVRNTCHAWHSSTRHSATEVFDEELHSGARSTLDPEALALHADAVVRLEHALENLPERFRELLVLREMKGLSYRELAEVLRIPVASRAGTASKLHTQGVTVRPKQIRAFIVLPFVFALSAAAWAAGKPAINTSRRDLALRGYDAVAYWSEGKPLQGLASFEYRWMNAVWRFASAEHRDQFSSQRLSRCLSCTPLPSSSSIWVCRALS
jgi:hypothetical protein